ncbi:HAUS augmin-like complex subunit 6 isoform X2 [Argopecten irradians]|uniref:HAUS augmin-like complex subunit 6 isoform X2 n=1 Tax=Argopecten irradians TaxID=31199 RepID=UPI003710D276
MGDTLDLRQMLFTNLQLLGFDSGAMAASYSLPFNKDMFNLPNKKGAEVVLHFLFNKLNPIMCREEFRDCWPVLDKQQEQQFRRTCHNWLVNIAKTEPEAHLPRIVASHFMSPGGDKFYDLLFHFSGYVLRTLLQKENGVKDFEQLRYPQLSSQTDALGDVIAKNMQCAVVRLRKKFLEESQTTLMLNREWKAYTGELVKDYRKQSKEVREKEHLERTFKQQAADSAVARGSPIRRRRSDCYDNEFDPQSTKRTQRIQQVRDMWKQVNDFCEREAAEREVIESIVDRTMSQHKIDAASINIKVPDLLLRECEQEIRQRHVDNTFHGGKLNLVSLLQLWNLCLHLYIERLHQVGVPDFSDDLGAVTQQVHSNHAYLTNTRTLKKEVSVNLPKLKQSVEQLRDQLDSHNQNSTPRSTRSTNLGLGLMEPSPSLSFTPGQAFEGGVSVRSALSRTPQNETTPEAASKLVQGIAKSVRQGHEKLFQGSPEYVPRVNISSSAAKKKAPATKVPRKVSKMPSKGAKTRNPPDQRQATLTNSKSYSTARPAHTGFENSYQSATSSSREQSLSSGDRTLTGITSCTGGSPVENTSPKHPSPRTPPTMVQRSPATLSPSDVIVNRMMAPHLLDQSDDEDLMSAYIKKSRELEGGSLSGFEQSPKSGSSRGEANLSQHSVHDSPRFNTKKMSSSINSPHGSQRSESQRSPISDVSKHSQDSLKNISRSYHESPRSQTTRSLLESLTGNSPSHVSLEHSQEFKNSPRSEDSHQSGQSSVRGSVHSISSNLSRPSGLVDMDDQSPHSSLHSGHSIPMNTSKSRLISTENHNKSVELDSSKHTLHNDSFELEQPEFLPLDKSDKESVNSGLPTPQYHSDHSLPISNGPETSFKLDFGSPGADDDLNQSDESCPTSARALMKSHMEVCDTMPEADQPEPEPMIMVDSPLSKDVRDMWKEALKTTDSPKSGKRTNLSFSDTGLSIDLGGAGDGNFPTFEGLGEIDGEQLDDIQLPNMSMDEITDGMQGIFEDKGRSPKLDLIRGFTSLDSVKTGSLGDQVYTKPNFPQTDEKADDNDILISLTPHQPVIDNSLHLQTSPWLVNIAPSGQWSGGAKSTGQWSGGIDDGDAGLEDGILFLEGQDLELVDDLDDSFVPLKGGFQLEGGTPGKSQAQSRIPGQISSVSAPSSNQNSFTMSLNDGSVDRNNLTAWFQKLKQTSANIRGES